MGIFKYMLKKGPGSPGATARVMTENYYKLFFDGEHSKDNAIGLLEFRNDAYEVQGIGLSFDKIIILSENFYSKIPLLVFCMSCFENTLKQNQLNLFIENRKLIFDIIVEEYNKLCPSKEQYNRDDMDEVKLLNVINFMLER